MAHDLPLFAISRRGGAISRPVDMPAAEAEDQFMANVAINGLGRIGRATLKVVMDTPGLNLVAANDLAVAATSHTS
jgi:glutamate dehydrogenase/leucine dehydrogenase